MFAQSILEDFSEDRRYHFKFDFRVVLDILEGFAEDRFLQKLSEVFTLWVFTLDPFPEDGRLVSVETGDVISSLHELRKGELNSLSLIIST